MSRSWKSMSEWSLWEEYCQSVQYPSAQDINVAFVVRSSFTVTTVKFLIGVRTFTVRTHTPPQKKRSNTIHACLSMHFACGATNIKKLQIRAPAPPSSVRGRLLSGSSSNAVPLKDHSWSVKMISAFASCVGLTSLTSSKESLLLSFTKVGILFLAWQILGRRSFLTHLDMFLLQVRLWASLRPHHCCLARFKPSTKTPRCFWN